MGELGATRGVVMAALGSDGRRWAARELLRGSDRQLRAALDEDRERR